MCAEFTSEKNDKCISCQFKMKMNGLNICVAGIVLGLNSYNHFQRKGMVFL